MIISENINVFISYSWEEDRHQEWVRNLANRLLSDGINVNLDQYDFKLGDRLPHSMEKSIKDSDYVIIICTPTYKKKADQRTSGVGYEGHIISDEIYNKGNERKFIPILRKGTYLKSLPEFLKGKMGVSLTVDDDFEVNYNDLLANLYGAKHKPEVGKRPGHFKDATSPLPKSDDEEIKIIGIITDEVTLPKNDGSRGSALYKIPFRLNKSPNLYWKKLFINNWNYPPKFTTMHRPGIASVFRDKIILDGTTIDEVKNVHRDTLILCVDKTNEQMKEYNSRQKKTEEEKRLRENNHYKRIDSISDEINF